VRRVISAILEKISQKNVPSYFLRKLKKLRQKKKINLFLKGYKDPYNTWRIETFGHDKYVVHQHLTNDVFFRKKKRDFLLILENFLISDFQIHTHFFRLEVSDDTKEFFGKFLVLNSKT